MCVTDFGVLAQERVLLSLPKASYRFFHPSIRFVLPKIFKKVTGELETFLLF